MGLDGALSLDASRVSCKWLRSGPDAKAAPAETAMAPPKPPVVVASGGIEACAAATEKALSQSFRLFGKS